MLDLYLNHNCPYCKKVISFLEKHNIKFNNIDVGIKENIEKLLSLGGKEQVPFLYDSENKTKMYESSDIISYIAKKQGIENE